MSYRPDRERIVRRIATGVSINAANTDVATFANLPAKCRLRKMTVFEASTSLAISAATIGAYDAAAAGGLALVTPALITGLTAATKCQDMTVIATDYSTTGTVVIRNAIAHGGAATVSVAIEVEDLTG